jgi:hypothetical protein
VAASFFTYDPEIDVGTWEGIRDELPRLLDDPELLGRLSSHFVRTDALLRMNESWVERGRAPEKTRSDVLLRADIVRLADALHAESGVLRDEVEAVVHRLDTPPPTRRIPAAPTSYLSGRPVDELPEKYRNRAATFRRAVASGDLSEFFPERSDA